ncbi:MAG: DUF3488 and transglutaminase-like domain-containing protein [Planctomycetaceae bacterium]|jgi:hypothetical protein|nr:DUF3488 and transglutaminase-like domain-containing protein [Planctomycetaceae bacterium]
MRSFFNFAIMLSMMPCLSTLMLGVGQDDILLPILMLIAACLSLYVTDYKRLIRLGDWTVNVLILAIVFMTIGDILRHWGEALAISIVRTLVFVEIVLLFREKDSKLCWQILLISLLQVLVASAMHQSMVFGVLLIIYLFIGLCTLALIFLRNENLYYQRHSFAPSLSEMVREEIAARQDYGRLVRLALLTLCTGPIALAMSFSSNKSNLRNTTEPETEAEKSNRKEQNERWDLIRNLFAVFAKDQNKTNASNSKNISLAKNLASSNYSFGDNGAIAERTWVQVPIHRVKRSKKRGKKENVKISSDVENKNRAASNNRYPFFSERASFSAGTMYPVGIVGDWRDLFFRLFRSTFLIILVAVILFFLIPRIGKIDFWQLNWTFGNSRWETAFIPRVGAIGFREEIRLGSLGAILPYHSEVMTVKFNKTPDGRIPTSGTTLNPYNEIGGASLYFRGIALTKYSNGIWNPQDEQSIVSKVINEYNEKRIKQEKNKADKTPFDIKNSIQTIIETINKNATLYVNNLYGGNIATDDNAEKNKDEFTKTTDNQDEILSSQIDQNQRRINQNLQIDQNIIPTPEVEPRLEFRPDYRRRRYNNNRSSLTFRRPTIGEVENAPPDYRERVAAQRLRMFFKHPLFGVRPGDWVETGDGAELFFEDGYDLVQLNMSIQPLDTSVFFAPWPFFSIDDSGGKRGMLTYSHGSLHEMRLHGSRQVRQIYTTSFRRGNQAELIPCQEPFAEEDMLQVPEQGLEKLILLAKKWDRESGLPKDNIIGRAKYLENQFLESEQFHYQLGGTKRDYDLDPLEDFIAKNNHGHCEYFAGALAIMLRSVGIGARVIVGFKSEAVKLPSNEVGCMIRQSDAHSWVEAFIPKERLPAELIKEKEKEKDQKSLNGDNNHTINTGNPNWWNRGGWLRLDPTPLSTNDTIMKRFSFRLTDFVNMVKEFWNYGVLNMNSERQTTWVYNPIGNTGQYLYERVFNVEFWKATFLGVVNYYKELFFRGGGVTWQMRDRFLFGLFFVLVAIFLLLVGLLIWRLSRLLIGRRSRSIRNGSTVEFYLRMEYLLTKYTRSRFPYETPLEYIRSISPFELTSPVLVTYYSVRYGGANLTSEELRTIKISLDNLENELEKRKQLAKQFEP